MKKATWFLLVAFALASTTVACGNKEADKGGAKADAPKGDDKKADDKKADDKKADDKKADAKKADGGDITVEKFATEAPANICTWMDTCKNEEVVFAVNSMVMMLVAFGGMAKPDMAKEIEEKLAPLKKADEEGRTKLNKDECGALMGVGAKLMGFDGATLKASIDAKRATFDAKAASSCLASLKGDLKICKEEKKLTKKPGLAEMEKMMKPYEAELDKHFASCEKVFIGQVDAGGACMEDYECKDGGKCKGDKPGAKEKKCKAAPAAPAP